MQGRRGFTLIELLFSITLLAVILSLALPSLERLRLFSQSVSAAQQLMAILNFSRQQSVINKISVSICPTQDSVACSHNWDHPLMIFHDDNSNGSREAEETILRYSDILEKGEKLVWKASGSRDYIRYKFMGETRNQNGRLSYCSRKNRVIVQIVLYHTGRARVAKTRETKLHC